MGKAIKTIKRKRQAQATLTSVLDNTEHCILIHYSCESFYDRPDGSSPRITSIAVRNFGSAQTTSFSIHQIAERNNVPVDDIPNKYDELEKSMLDEFYEYVRRHANHKWLHWNMRDINYGFPALAHRYQVLGGTPETIDESKLVDIARLLVAVYGPGYTGHPRMVTLINKNRISDRDLLSGEQEAEAFEAGDYVNLHRSTLRKVDIFANILERFGGGTLKTNTHWKDHLLLYPTAAGELVKEHWTFAVLALLISIASLVISLKM